MMHRFLSYLSSIDRISFKWHKLLAACCIILSMVIALLGLYWLFAFIIRVYLPVSIPIFV